MDKLLFPVTEPKRQLAELYLLLYGLAKTGKTTLASHMRDKTGRPPFFILTEDGSGNLKLSAQRVTSWSGFKRLLTKLEANKTELLSQYSCIIVDLISDLDDLCADHIAEQFEVLSIGDVSHGNGYVRMRSEFKKQLRRLMDILPVTFIAHSEERDISVCGEEKIKMQTPMLDKKNLAYINGKVDGIIYLQHARNNDEFPLVVMKGSVNVLAGCRFDQMVRNFKLDIRDMAKTFNEMQEVFDSES